MDWATVTDWLLEHGIRILIIIALGVILWFLLNKFIRPIVNRIVDEPDEGETQQGLEKRKNTIVGVFQGIGKVLIIVVIVLLILSEAGIAIGPMLAGIGIVGVAVGFGGQYLVRDLIAGIFITSENQYRVGDVVKVAGVTGTVEEISLRKTVLRDIDAVVHHVPNGEISVASNYTRSFARINLNISVAYDTDLDYAMGVINRVCDEMSAGEDWKSKIVNKPQALRVDNLGDSGIDIKILGDVKPGEQWGAMGELRLRLKKAFDSEGIEIPWPHTKVFFGNSPESAGK
jgi:small-conductance mechanosensitive channel